MSTGISCPSCGQCDVADLGAIPDGFGFGGRSLSVPLPGGNLYRCKECSLRFRYPRLSKSELDKLYVGATAEIWQSAVKNRPDWELAAQLIFAAGKNRRVLDVGCFDGHFLSTLGEEYEKFGIEIHPEAARRAEARGISIVASDLDHLGKLPDRYDIVVAMDVLEHVANPKAFLESLSKMLRPGGMMVISTGDAESLPFRIMRGMYWYSSIAEHISFVNVRWCSRIARELGLSVASVSRFTHKPAPIFRTLVFIAANLLFRLSPLLALRIRRLANLLTGKPHKPTDQVPPPWPAARDHLMVVFGGAVRLPT